MYKLCLQPIPSGKRGQESTSASEGAWEDHRPEHWIHSSCCLPTNVFKQTTVILWTWCFLKYTEERLEHDILSDPANVTLPSIFV